jgi:hypothetical protein
MSAVNPRRTPGSRLVRPCRTRCARRRIQGDRRGPKSSLSPPRRRFRRSARRNRRRWWRYISVRTVRRQQINARLSSARSVRPHPLLAEALDEAALPRISVPHRQHLYPPELTDGGLNHAPHGDIFVGGWRWRRRRFCHSCHITRPRLIHYYSTGPSLCVTVVDRVCVIQTRRWAAGPPSTTQQPQGGAPRQAAPPHPAMASRQRALAAGDARGQPRSPPVELSVACCPPRLQPPPPCPYQPSVL